MRLRTRFALVMTCFALFVVAMLSYMFAAQLLEQLIRETDNRAADLAEQVFLNATINRELALLRRAFSLGYKSKPRIRCPTRFVAAGFFLRSEMYFAIWSVPTFAARMSEHMLEENNARTGFVNEAQY